MRLRSGENAAFWNLTILSCGCPLAGLKDAERNSFLPSSGLLPVAQV